MHRTVEQVLHAKLLPTGNGDPAALRQAAARRIAGIDRTASQNDERGDVAPLERQRLDGLVVDDCADRWIASLHEWRRRFDGHRFLESAEQQPYRYDGIAVDLEDDAGLQVGAEAGKRHFESIRTNRQVGECVGPAHVADDLATEAGLCVQGNDRGTRKHPAAFVHDGSVDLSCGLSPRV